ncbi:MAG TPA: exodeoxyribonuclease I, partial [Coxiellaceae bacterium]|nr:exodeoxyribonuclease I [Coxiellaceae bacterium]
RMDLYPIAILYYLFCPNVIQWPVNDNKVSLKLENLSALNQLATGQAHNAMVDVIATVELAKRFKQETKMWDYVRGYFDKKTELERLNQLSPAYQHIDAGVKEALLIHGKLGSTNYFQAPALALGPHQIYKNQSLWLRLDHSKLSKLDHKEFAQQAFVFRKRHAEAPILLPTIPRFLKYLSPERNALVNANKEFLAEHPELLKSLCDYHQNYIYPNLENVDLDAALYQRGFPSTFEEQLNAQFHCNPPNGLINLLTRFSNNQQLSQAIRVLGRHHPELLNEEQSRQFKDYLARCYGEEDIIDYKGEPRLTLNKALTQIDEITEKQNLDTQQKALLSELKTYLENLSLLGSKI